ncbi:MAG: GGDEF domain-containing protein [Mariniblastus sp.]
MVGTARFPTLVTTKVATEQEPKPSSNFQGNLLQIHPVNLGQGLIKLTDEPFVIGREFDCDLACNEEAVSRRHLHIKKTSAGYRLVDLDSTNGTWVNEKNEITCLLKSGDRIRVGSRIFKFISTDKLEADYHEAVYNMMTRDSLTGAWNKRYFRDMLEREIKRSVRSGRPVALLMIDLDHFKMVNDEHGHLVGDEVLAEMSKRILDTIRGEDIFARYGGEEFAVVLSEVDAEETRVVAERCRLAISETPFETTGGNINCTMSVGFALASKNNPLTMTELIRSADGNLYNAKRRGRNQVDG